MKASSLPSKALPDERLQQVLEMPESTHLCRAHACSALLHLHEAGERKLPEVILPFEQNGRAT